MHSADADCVRLFDDAVGGGEEEEEEEGGGDGERARRWCATAVAAVAFAHYHHRARRLLSCLGWVDADLFEEVRSRIRARCTHGASDVAFDCMLRHVGTHTVTQYRCCIVADGVPWLVVYADHLGPSARLRACVPAAISDDVEECGVFNVRTGETQTYRMTDRAPLRARLELA